MKWITCLLCCSLSLLGHAQQQLLAEEDDLEEFDDQLAENEEIEDDQEEVAQENWGDLEELIESETTAPQKEKTPRLEARGRQLATIETPEEEPASLPVEVDQLLSQDESLVSRASPLDVVKEKTLQATHTIQINFKEVFKGSPAIYLILLCLSVTAISIWLYSMLTVRSIEFLPPELIRDLRLKLLHNQYNEVLEQCVKEKHFFCKMVASGILVRKHGLSMMIETMKAEGKRATIGFWQRISVLNDIAIIAPMLGLLGTVLGMFYAFYDLNRTMESISLLFDGLGVSVGTTVAGLIVAILSMILYSSARYRLVRVLTHVENEAQTFAALIDTHAPHFLEGVHERKF